MLVPVKPQQIPSASPSLLRPSPRGSQKLLTDNKGRRELLDQRDDQRRCSPMTPTRTVPRPQPRPSQTTPSSSITQQQETPAPVFTLTSRPRRRNQARPPRRVQKRSPRRP